MKYTIKEAAEYLKVNPAFIYRLIHIGKLQYIRGRISEDNLCNCQKYLEGKYEIKVL